MEDKHYNELVDKRKSGIDISEIRAELIKKGYSIEKATATLNSIENSLLSKHKRRIQQKRSLLNNKILARVTLVIAVTAIVMSLTYFLSRIAIWIIEYEKHKENSHLLFFSVLGILIGLPLYLTAKDKIKRK